MELRGIVFDFDGTLSAPGALDFPAMRSAIGCPPGRPILEYIAALPAAAQAEAKAELAAIELIAAARSQPNDGAEAVLDELRHLQLPVAILTRNNHACILRTLVNFSRTGPADFAAIVTRDDDLPPKPAPDGVCFAAAALAARADQVLMVGDFRYDIEAGHSAGAKTVWLCSEPPDWQMTVAPDYTITHLTELIEIVRQLMA